MNNSFIPFVFLIRQDDQSIHLTFMLIRFYVMELYHILANCTFINTLTYIYHKLLNIYVIIQALSLNTIRVMLILEDNVYHLIV